MPRVERKVWRIVMDVALVFLSLVYSVNSARPANICPQSTPCDCKNDALLKSETVVNCQLRKLYGIPTFEGIGIVRKINLARNKITDVPENTFVGITTGQIDLSDNMISSMDGGAFHGLETSLNTLTLKSNRFASIPTESLKRLGELKVLNLDNNQGLVEINGSAFEGLSKLETLSLKQCSLSRLDEKSFVGLDKLRELIIYDNHLKEISPAVFLPLTSLRDLDLGYNGLDHVPARAFRHITSLSLNMNNFSSDASFDPEAFQSVSGTLKRLKLDHCRMRAIPKAALQPLNSLEKLDLNGNQIRTIEREDLSGLYRLEHLTLDDNKYVLFTQHAFAEVSNTLQYLSMRDMNLKTIPLKPLQELLALEWLDISENKFDSFNDGAFEGICATRFEITHSSLQIISKRAFRNTPNNLRVNLKGNVIDDMQFLKLPCKFQEADVDVICDCALYELLKKRKIHLKGMCRLPRDLEGITIDSDAYKLVSRKRCERNSSNVLSDQLPDCPPFDPSETGEFSARRCFSTSRDGDRGGIPVASRVSYLSASSLVVISCAGLIGFFQSNF